MHGYIDTQIHTCIPEGQMGQRTKWPKVVGAESCGLAVALLLLLFVAVVVAACGRRLL